jgi:hypothetical protein
MRTSYCLYLWIRPYSFLNAWTNLYETSYIYHGTWGYFNSTLHKPLPSVCMSVCVSLLLLLGNGSENTFPSNRIHTTIEELWMCHFLCGLCLIKGDSVGLSVYPLLLLGNNLVQTFPRQQRIAGHAVLYAVRVTSKEGRQLALLRTSCSILTSLPSQNMVDSPVEL